MKNLSKSDKLIILAVKNGYRFDEKDRIVGSTGKVKNIGRSKTGYPIFRITYPNERNPYPISVHRFKAYILYGEKLFEKGLEVRHKNGNPLDWSTNNIILGTSSDNKYDVPEEKRIKKSIQAASFLRKFSEKEIEEIREKRKNGYTFKRLSEEHKTVKSVISYIVNYKTYNNNKEKEFDRLKDLFLL